MRRVRATIVVVENNKYCTWWECVCSTSDPACNAHEPYSRLWPARLYRIFPYYLSKVTIIGGGGRECYWQ